MAPFNIGLKVTAPTEDGLEQLIIEAVGGHSKLTMCSGLLPNIFYKRRAYMKYFFRFDSQEELDQALIAIPDLDIEGLEIEMLALTLDTKAPSE